MDANLVIWLPIYFVVAWAAMRGLSGAWREGVFAGANLAGLYMFFSPSGKTGGFAFGAYVALIALQYLLMRFCAKARGGVAWLAFSVPILALMVVRYVPPAAYVAWGGPFPEWLAGRPAGFITVCFAGISYLAFRSSWLVLEVRNGLVPPPSFAKYVGFCFFLPTMSVGPISPFSVFDRAFRDDAPAIPAGRAGLRILVGLVKYLFLGSLCNQWSYAGLLQDGFTHAPVELAIAVVFYYIYLYLNFSGFCDMAIGAAGLMGIEVPENFNQPLAARNVKDFWNRWHITLSQYMRDVVFSPLSKYLAGLFGIRHVNHAVAVAIVGVFLLVGIWHGVGWNYACFGAMHALGVVTNHYYAIGLKKWLGRDRFRAYTASPLVHAVAVGLTFLYVAASLALFANSFPELREIWASIR